MQFYYLHFGGRGCIMYLQGKERALKNLSKKIKKVLTNNSTYGIIIIERDRKVVDTMKDKWLWLDMDGTFADPYGVNGWLDDLINLRTRPYTEAKPIYNMVDFLLLLVELKQRGWKIGIISWLSKDPNAEYGERVTKAKKEWLLSWCMDIVLDKVLIVPYGQCKADTCIQFCYGVLADDEEQNRNTWDLGDTIDANKNLLEELAKLL